MRDRFIRLIAILTALLLPFSQALADVSLLPEPDLAAQPLDVSVTVSLSAYSPLDDTRTGWLNDLLKYHELRLKLTSSCYTMSMLVDHSEAFSVSLSMDSSGSSVSTSLLPGKVYSAPLSGSTALDLLLGSTSGSSSGSMGLLPDTDSLQLLTDSEEMLTQLQTTAKDKLTSKKKKATIKGYGNVTRQLTLTVDEEEANEFGSLLINACPYGSLMDLLVSINFSGDQTLTLLVDDKGTVHKAVYEGICGKDGNMRRYKLTWLLSRSGSTVKDELTASMPPASSSGSDTLSFTRSETSDGKGGFTGKYSYSRSANLRSGKYSAALEASLTGKPGENGDTGITCTAALDTSGDDEETKHLTFDLDAGLDTKTWIGNANVRIRQTSGGNTLTDASLAVAITAAEQTVATATDLPVTDISKLTDQELLDARTEMLSNAAKALVARWMQLPEDGSMYISKDLPDDVWLRLCFAALDLTEEEE